MSKPLNTRTGKGTNDQINIDFVRLETAWLGVYKAWLELDPIQKQMYRMPDRPVWLRGRILIEDEQI